MQEGDNKEDARGWRVGWLLVVGGGLALLLLGRSVYSAVDSWAWSLPHSSPSFSLAEPPELPPSGPISESNPQWVLDPVDDWGEPPRGSVCELVMATRTRYPRWAPRREDGGSCEPADTPEELLSHGWIGALEEEGTQFALDPGGALVLERRGDRELAIIADVGLVVRSGARKVKSRQEPARAGDGAFSPFGTAAVIGREP